MRNTTVLVILFFIGNQPLRAADTFEDKVVPFLKTYCVECHNQKRKSAELDLTRYDSTSKLIQDFKQWEHVVTFTRKEEMPPSKAKQPTDAERQEFLKSLENLLISEARQITGDPGVVMPRRLSNAEFDYSIMDLTGVDIRPTRSFPVDPSSGEGFNNTGEALTMSPSLFRKYYAAAQEVAEHALLASDGLHFAPHPVVTFADRQKYYEQKILKFYQDHKVDYEVYLGALWLYQHRPASQKSTTLGEWAFRQKLSSSYLSMLGEALTKEPPKEEVYLNWAYQRWQSIPKPADPAKPELSAPQKTAIAALAQEIRDLSMRLCPPETPAIVPNAGNGPVNHLDNRRRMARSRMSFDPDSLTRQRFFTTVKNDRKAGIVRLTMEVSANNPQNSGGFVLVDGAFTMGNPANSNLGDARKKNMSLRAVLEKHSPQKAASLGFGKLPNGMKGQQDILAIQVPGLIELEIPSAAFEENGNLKFFADCKLESSTQGQANLRIWGDSKQGSTPTSVMVFQNPHPNLKTFQLAGDAFCRLFPNRFYYVDETRGLSAGFHLVEGFFRDDQPLSKLVLDAKERAEIDSLWSELYFATDIWQKMLRGFVFFERSERNFMKHPDFDSIREEDPELPTEAVLKRFQEIYLRRSNVKATGAELENHPVTIFFGDIRNGLSERRKLLNKASDYYLRDLEDFARRAYRRPLQEKELKELRDFYAQSCKNSELGIEQAVGLSIIRILVSPHFNYHLTSQKMGATVARLSGFELASRLSYFLWSSGPDDELLRVAAEGKLQQEETLRQQARRMIRDPRFARFSQEFFGQWLGYRDFLSTEAVNRQVFPVFEDGLKQAMFEEPTRLATYLLQENRPITELLNSDKTFVNARLAKHYGMAFQGKPDSWEMVEGLHQSGRGGLLGMSVFLTKNSQPQRTSPVKRGFWVVSKLLGEHIPPPPPDVAVLPAKETDTQGKTIRELLVLHTEDNRCARCHVRFDSIGLAMEGFDPIGKRRIKDLAGRAIDDTVPTPGGGQTRGVSEFSKYLAASRGSEFTKNYCRKLLGYALGRSLQLSDHSLLEKMQSELDNSENRSMGVFEAIVTSPQFLNQRSRDFSLAKFIKEAKGN